MTKFSQRNKCTRKAHYSTLKTRVNKLTFSQSYNYALNVGKILKQVSKLHYLKCPCFHYFLNIKSFLKLFFPDLLERKFEHVRKISQAENQEKNFDFGPPSLLRLSVWSRFFTFRCFGLGKVYIPLGVCMRGIPWPLSTVIPCMIVS